jgi:hypothetical protein
MADTLQVPRGNPMSNPARGGVAGLIFGVAAAVLMLPMDFPDKTAAITAAFLHRFGIGLVIGCVRLTWPGWAVGLLFGLLLSLPDAIITKAYAPILVLGAVGGLLIGGFIHGWRTPRESGSQ